jgi:plastocyanin
MRLHTGTPLCLLVALVAACSNGATDKPTEQSPGGTASPTPSAAPSVQPTGKVIVIEMYTDEKGNYFKPAKFEAHRGDLLRFTLKAGVHNVHFLADSNPGKTGLPPVSEFLQLPDQTWDYLVSLAPGHYYFQCDPHALLGMIGRLEVEDEN